MLIANELINARKKSKVEGVIFKIDLEKAYDHVDWNFIDYMLYRFGFGNTWCRWMEEHISSTSLFVLVNGSPSKLFKASRGFKARESPFPFLFTIAVDALSMLLVRAREVGMTEGFKVN